MIMETDPLQPDVPAELRLSRYAIYKGTRFCQTLSGHIRDQVSALRVYLKLHVTVIESVCAQNGIKPDHFSRSIFLALMLSQLHKYSDDVQEMLHRGAIPTGYMDRFPQAPSFLSNLLLDPGNSFADRSMLPKAFWYDIEYQHKMSLLKPFFELKERHWTLIADYYDKIKSGKFSNSQKTRSVKSAALESISNDCIKACTSEADHLFLQMINNVANPGRHIILGSSGHDYGSLRLRSSKMQSGNSEPLFIRAAACGNVYKTVAKLTLERKKTGTLVVLADSEETLVQFSIKLTSILKNAEINFPGSGSFKNGESFPFSTRIINSEYSSEDISLMKYPLRGIHLLTYATISRQKKNGIAGLLNRADLLLLDADLNHNVCIERLKSLENFGGRSITVLYNGTCVNPARKYFKNVKTDIQESKFMNVSVHMIAPKSDSTLKTDHEFAETVSDRHDSGSRQVIITGNVYEAQKLYYTLNRTFEMFRSDRRQLFLYHSLFTIRDKMRKVSDIQKIPVKDSLTVVTTLPLAVTGNLMFDTVFLMSSEITVILPELYNLFHSSRQEDGNLFVASEKLFALLISLMRANGTLSPRKLRSYIRKQIDCHSKAQSEIRLIPGAGTFPQSEIDLSKSVCFPKMSSLKMQYLLLNPKLIHQESKAGFAQYFRSSNPYSSELGLILKPENI